MGNPRGGATGPAGLRANGGLAVAEKHPELTAVYTMVAVEVGEG